MQRRFRRLSLVALLATVFLAASLAGAAPVADAVAGPTDTIVVEPFAVPFDAVIEALLPGSDTRMWGCPSSASFTCDEPCYPQRVNCIANCNGNFDCVGTCMICWRECEFLC